MNLIDTFTKECENEAIRYAVSKAMFCKQCKAVLDMKKSTVITVRHNTEVLWMQCVCDNCMTRKGTATREQVQKEMDYAACKTFYQLKGIRVNCSFEHYTDPFEQS